MANSLAIREFYVADLNAIAGGQGNWQSIERVAAQSDRLWLDLGFGQANHVLALVPTLWQLQQHCPAITLIIGLESVASQRDLACTIDALRTDFLAAGNSATLAFSLDLRDGQPITSVPEWRHKEVISIAQTVYQLGIRKFVALDLAAVGTNNGCPTLELCRMLRERYPSSEIVTGGGVRHRADLDRIAEAGCDGALVASALHSGVQL